MIGIEKTMSDTLCMCVTFLVISLFTLGNIIRLKAILTPTNVNIWVQYIVTTNTLH